MISQIDISGFRSIKEAKIPLKKLNILYGQNGSGKSSVMYAPYVFRNFCVNPNQRLNRLFDLGFMNLGGIEEVSNHHCLDIKIGVTKHSIYFNTDLNYTINLNNSIFPSTVNFNMDDVKGTIELDFPYILNNKIEINLDKDNSMIWNGIVFEEIKIRSNGFMFIDNFNNLYEEIKNVEIISVKRGFFNPLFSTESPTEESLFAMQIRDQGVGFESKIDHYFKQLFDKTFRFVAIPGSTSFYLKTQNKKGITTDLVNEGFGVNQTVYMLIKLLKKSTSLAFIEEPEIHLHPSAQAKLVDVFAEIVQKEDKQIFITTHSENIVSSVLAKIAAGELSRDDVQFYLAKKEDDETKIIPQEVNDKGQIEGGLMNFMEAELSNLKTLLGL